MGKAIDRMVAIAKGDPTTGKIVTPDMVREEQRVQALADRGQNRERCPPAASSRIRRRCTRKTGRAVWDRPIIPGQDPS